MNIKENVEQNVIAWLLGTLITGFGSGLATYEAIIRIANLRVVPSSEDPAELEKKLVQCQSERGSAESDRLPNDFLSYSENARQLLARITAPDTEGAGTIVAVADKKAYIVTAKHVVFFRGKLVEGLQVEFVQPQNVRLPVDVNSIKLHYSEDLAAFSVDLSAHWALQNAIEEALPVASLQKIRDTQLGEFLYVAGHSTASSWQVSLPGDYKFYRSDGSAFLVTGSCPQGFAGGAIYGKQWKILGMAIEEERPFCRAIPIALVRDIFKSWYGFDLGFKD